MQVFGTVNKVWTMINAYMNVRNWLTKEYVIWDLFVILIIVNLNVINHVMLKNIKIMKIVSVEKD